MTQNDPFATAPDEAQAAPAPAAPPEPPPAPAPAPEPTPTPEEKAKPATKARATKVTNVATSSETGVSMTFKGGPAFDAPWIVFHAADLEDAFDQVSGDNASLLAKVMERVQTAGKYFTSLAPTPVAVAAGGGSGAAQPAQGAPPAGATGAPGGETRNCPHGVMQYKTGFSAKTNKNWAAFMCPSPKGTPGQCEAEWIR